MRLFSLARARTFFLMTLMMVLVFGAAFDAQQCACQLFGGASCQTGGNSGNLNACTGYGGTPGCISAPGGIGYPTDPYSWIEDLPLYGQTPQVTGWWQVSGSLFPVPLYYYGVVDDEAVVVNPAVWELRLSGVFLQLSVQSQLAWKWSGFSIWDAIYSQKNLLTNITIALNCQCTIQQPSGYLTVFGCNNNFPPIDAQGMNAIAHFQPDVEIGGDVAPINNYYIDFAHKLSQ